MELEAFIRQFTVYALPVLFAITVHEASHAYVARYFGDYTAFSQGRMTLNPARHIDPLGTVVVPLLTLLFGGVLFGWAKPVPVNAMQLRNPRRHMIWVALAGPISNLIMALLWAIVLKLLLSSGQQAGFLWEVSRVGLVINVVLAVLNLLPILPLDGGRVVHNLLPPDAARSYAKLEPFGLLILVALIFTGVLSPILHYGTDFFLKLIWRLVF